MKQPSHNPSSTNVRTLRMRKMCIFALISCVFVVTTVLSNYRWWRIDLTTYATSIQRNDEISGHSQTSSSTDESDVVTTNVSDQVSNVQTFGIQEVNQNNHSHPLLSKNKERSKSSDSNDVPITKASAQALQVQTFSLQEMNQTTHSPHRYHDESLQNDKRVGVWSRDKPYLVLHVGPGKTGTSTIQAIVPRFINTTLQQDHYIYDGRHGKNGTPLTKALMDEVCRTQVHDAVTSNSSMPACWEDMEKVLTSYKGKNVLMSEETMNFHRLGSTPGWWIPFQNLAEEKLGFKILIVLAYRRLYEWFPSFHSQGNKLTKEKFNQWPIENDTKYKKVSSVRKWLLSNPFVDPSIADPWTWDPNKSTTYWLPTFISAVPKNIESHIFNFHGGEGSLSTRFVCDSLPFATKTCKRCKEIDAKNDKPLVFNQAGSTVSDVLAVAAAEAGLIDTSKYKRQTVRAAVYKYNRESLNRTDMDLPYLCPTEKELNMILNATLYWEKELMPSMNDESSHIAGFWKYVEKKKFCDLDTDSVLQYPEWKSFFMRFAGGKRR